MLVTNPGGNFRSIYLGVGAATASRMPKAERGAGRAGPYSQFLEDRQYGRVRHGAVDRLYRQMADDMLQTPDRWVPS